jgi:hypothetical protein
MLQIAKYLVDILIADASIQSALGGTVLDPRVYAWNSPFDVAYNSTTPAAIFYNYTMDSRPAIYSYPMQIPDQMFNFQIVCSDRTKLEQIIELIFNLFLDYTFHTSNFSVKTMEVKRVTESPFEGTPTKPLFIKTITFSLLNVFKRSPSASSSPSVSASRSASVSASSSSSA